MLKEGDWYIQEYPNEKEVIAFGKIKFISQCRNRITIEEINAPGLFKPYTYENMAYNNFEEDLHKVNMDLFVRLVLSKISFKDYENPFIQQAINEIIFPELDLSTEI